MRYKPATLIEYNGIWAGGRQRQPRCAFRDDQLPFKQGVEQQMAAVIKRQHTARKSHDPDGVASDQLHQHCGHAHTLAGETRGTVDPTLVKHSVKTRFRQAIQPIVCVKKTSATANPHGVHRQVNVVGTAYTLTDALSRPYSRQMRVHTTCRQFERRLGSSFTTGSQSWIS
ncbi:MAG: hypothetical protein ACRETZ_00615 [Steroidobacteraceae bacterium]